MAIEDLKYRVDTANHKRFDELAKALTICQESREILRETERQLDTEEAKLKAQIVHLTHVQYLEVATDE